MCNGPNQSIASCAFEKLVIMEALQISLNEMGTITYNNIATGPSPVTCAPNKARSLHSGHWTLTFNLRQRPEMYFGDSLPRWVAVTQMVINSH